MKQHHPQCMVNHQGQCNCNVLKPRTQWIDEQISEWEDFSNPSRRTSITLNFPDNREPNLDIYELLDFLTGYYKRAGCRRVAPESKGRETSKERAINRPIIPLARVWWLCEQCGQFSKDLNTMKSSDCMILYGHKPIKVKEIPS